MYIYIYPYTYERGPETPGIYKKLCIDSYVFILQSPSEYCPFDTVHLSRLFSLLKIVFEVVDFDVF